MSHQRYYRLSLLLPVLLPLFVAGTHELVVRSGLEVGAWLHWPAVFLLASLGYGGVGYAVFALGALIALRGRSRSTYRLAVWSAPVVVLGLQMALLEVQIAVLDLLPGGGSAEIDHPQELYARFTLGFGYAYVLMVELGGWILAREAAVPRRSHR